MGGLVGREAHPSGRAQHEPRRPSDVDCRCATGSPAPFHAQSDSLVRTVAITSQNRCDSPLWTVSLIEIIGILVESLAFGSGRRLLIALSHNFFRQRTKPPSLVSGRFVMLSRNAPQTPFHRPEQPPPSRPRVPRPAIQIPMVDLDKIYLHLRANKTSARKQCYAWSHQEG